MSEAPSSTPARSRYPAAALGALWIGLAALALWKAPDGREHGDFGQFLGRFHPLFVHAPVALLALVALMEMATLGGRRGHLRAAAGWILAVAVAAAYAAAIDGWILAWSAGFRGRDVTRHMWGGVWLCAACTVALWARGRPGSAGFRGPVYAAFLAASLLLLAWTGHFGGSLTHGDGFLTEKMPPSLRAWLGMKAPAPAPAEATPAAVAVSGKASGGLASTDPSNPLYYTLHIAPLFERSCVSCHKAEKHKGGLRMDTLEQLMKGGSDGPAVVAGKPAASELVRRVHLPSSDDDFMPSDGEKPLTPEEITMIERWIAFGVKSK